MLTCKEVTQKVSQSLDRQLTLRERLSVRMHLLFCYACRRFVKQLSLLTTAVQGAISRDRLHDDGKLADTARQRIRQRLQDAIGKPESPE